MACVGYHLLWFSDKSVEITEQNMSVFNQFLSEILYLDHFSNINLAVSELCFIFL